LIELTEVATTNLEIAAGLPLWFSPETGAA